MNALRPGKIFGLSAALVCLVAGSAMADYVQNFEGLPFGVPGNPVVLTGLDGYYIPSGTTSTDWIVATYLLNAYNIVQNPNGGTVYVSGEGPGDGATFARAQHNIALTSAVWEFAYDFCCYWVPGGTPANNLGSFSAQPAPNDFIHLFGWVPGLEGVAYSAGYMFYDATNTQFPQPGNIPGPEWDNLSLNHWYRSTMTLDFTLNRCVEVSIADIQVGGAPVTFAPTDWYMEGGPGGSTTPMTDFRYFAGGSAPGNVVCIDNTSIRELGATPVVPATWGGIKASFK